MEQMYQEVILDHYKHPHHRGLREPFGAEVLTDLLIGQTVGDALKTVAAFNEMISSRGNIEGDEDVLGDGIAFAGVAKYPARIKCALLSWMAFKDAVAQAGAELTIEETPDERHRSA